jgi:uncharacterized protein (TIGR01777 family)
MSGVLGSALAESLTADGNTVVGLDRNPPQSPGRFRWDPPNGAVDAAAFDGVDAVVNLTGAPIGDRRWTETRKRLIRDSRVVPTQLLADTLANLPSPPPVLVSQSAMGYYGDREDEVLDETAAAGPDSDFLVRVTTAWEAAADPARVAGIRVVHPRTGLVLVPGTQLLGRLVPLFKLGLGGPISTGRQWWSWLTLEDQIRALRFLIATDLHGPVNLATPNPVRNEEFAQTLGEVLRRPSRLRVPRTGLKVVMGSEAAETIGYSSIRLDPAELTGAGFTWNQPEVSGALRGLLG